MKKLTIAFILFATSFSALAINNEQSARSESCGVIAVLNIPAGSNDLYKTSIIKINGERMKQKSTHTNNPDGRNYRSTKKRSLPTSYRLTPGQYSIELEYPKRAGRRSHLKIAKHVNQRSYKTKKLDLNIKPDMQYRLAIQHLPENKDGDAGTMWKAIVLSEHKANCNSRSAQENNIEKGKKAVQQDNTSETLMAELQQDVLALLQLIATQQEKEGKDIDQFYYSFTQPSQQEINLGLTVDLDSSTNSDGYQILSVAQNSGADKAGLKAEDRIIAIDSVELNANNQDWMLIKFRSLEIGNHLSLTINSQGKTRVAKLLVEGRTLPRIEFTIGAKPYESFKN